MFRDFSVYLLDLDGVLWTGSKPIPMAAEIIQKLRRRGKHIRFVSNTSGTDVERMLRKFAQMGIEAYRHELVLASFESANYVDQKKPGGLVYLIGYESLYR